MRFRWRKRITIPGFIIHVKFTDDRGLAGKEADWDYDMSKGEGVIRIHSGLKEAAKRRAFAHEMQHAMVDYLHYTCPDLDADEVG